MGSEHAISDENATRALLWEEVRKLDDNKERLIVGPHYETISPDGRVLRVHLRPFMENHSELEAISDAFIETAKSFERSIANLRRYWSYTEQMAAAGRLPSDSFQLASFLPSKRIANFWQSIIQTATGQPIDQPTELLPENFCLFFSLPTPCHSQISNAEASQTTYTIQ